MYCQILVHIAAGYALPKSFGGQERSVIFFDNGTYNASLNALTLDCGLGYKNTVFRLKLSMENQLRSKKPHGLEHTDTVSPLVSSLAIEYDFLFGYKVNRRACV